MTPAHDPQAFELPSTASATMSLERFRGRVPVVVAFIGSHETPQAVVSALADAQVELAHRSVQLLTVVRGPMQRVAELAPERSGLVLLADGDGAVTEAYDADRGADTVAVVEYGLEGVERQRFDLHVDPQGSPPDLLARLGETRSEAPADTDVAQADLEAWDPMPEDLKALDGVNEADLPGHPMDGPAPTG